MLFYFTYEKLSAIKKNFSYTCIEVSLYVDLCDISRDHFLIRGIQFLVGTKIEHYDPNYDKYIHQILYYVGHAYRVIKYFDSSAF